MSGLAVVYGFGILTSAVFTQGFPPWMKAQGFVLAGHPGYRILLGALGLATGVVALLVAIAFGGKAANLIAYRLGWIRVRESEGPCHLVEEGAGLWGLQLELTSESDRDTAWPLTLRLLEPPAADLYFRLDEASAGMVSRLFSPGESLRLRWIDLPASAGGPALLEIRSSLPEAAAATPPARGWSAASEGPKEADDERPADAA